MASHYPFPSHISKFFVIFLVVASQCSANYQLNNDIASSQCSANYQLNNDIASITIASSQCSANYQLNNDIDSSQCSANYQLNNDIASITIASKDYGNKVQNKPSFVLNPTSVDDIISLMRNSTLEKIAARGRGGTTQGQAMALGGVVVNMTALSKMKNRIVIGKDSSSSYYADVGAEQLWVDVLRSTLKKGYAPVSWTDYLYLTVGGTLSNAGISGQSFLHGPQITNVLQLDVVTGKGELVTCSPRKNSEIFFGVLGGLGQFGIITRARIVLDRAPKMAKWATLIYTDFYEFTKDQEHLISSTTGASSYVEGFLIVNTSTIDEWRFSGFSISDSSLSRIDALLRKHGVLYLIELAMYYDHDQNAINQEFETLLEKLNFIPGLNFSTDASFFDFLNRVGNLDSPEMGSELYHPWLNLFVPKSNITALHKHVLASMIPRLNQSSSPFIFYPLNKNKWNDAMSAVTPDLTPADEGVFYTFELLHSATHDTYQGIEDFNNEVLHVCKKFGIHVKHYLAYFKTKTDWKNHFGSKWGTFQARKAMLDPSNKLSPGQGIFN